MDVICKKSRRVRARYNTSANPVRMQPVRTGDAKKNRRRSEHEPIGAGDPVPARDLDSLRFFFVAV